MIEVAEIFISNDAAYLAVLGKTEVGFFLEIDAPIRSDLTVVSLTEALRKVVGIGNPFVRHPPQSELDRTTPIQKALGMRSWRKMAQVGVIRCAIWWTSENIVVAFSPRQTRDIQDTDFSSQRRLPPDTPLQTIAEIILTEVSDRRAGDAG